MKKKFKKSDFYLSPKSVVEFAKFVGPGAKKNDGNLDQDDNVQMKDGENARKFSGTAYSGEVIPRHGWITNLFIDLDTMYFKPEIPVLRNHTFDKIAGKAKLNVDKVLKIEGIVFDNDHGTEIQQLNDQGLAWELSVGAMPGSIEEVEAGMTVQVNGQTVTGPATILRNTRIYETSFVPVGADAAAHATLFQSAEEVEVEFVKLSKGEIDMKPTLLTNEEADNFEFCGCNGKQSVKKMNEDLEATKKALEESQAQAEELKKEIESIKKAEKEASVKAEIIAVGLEATDELVTKLAADDSMKDLFISNAKVLAAKAPKTEAKKDDKDTTLEAIKNKLGKREFINPDDVTIEKEELKTADDFEKAAEKLVKSGKAKNKREALIMLG